MVQFYQEFYDVSQVEPTGNVVVVYPNTRHRVAGQLVYEGLGRCYPNVLQDEQTPIEPDQPVTNWKVDTVWLQQYCERISEEEARLIHPYLFESYMDAELQERRVEERQHRVYLLCTLSLGLALGSYLVHKIVRQR